MWLKLNTALAEITISQIAEANERFIQNTISRGTCTQARGLPLFILPFFFPCGENRHFELSRRHSSTFSPSFAFFTFLPPFPLKSPVLCRDFGIILNTPRDTTRYIPIPNRRGGSEPVF